MSREKDQLTNTQDAGTFTQSGNHAAGGPANDTTQVNRAPNINPGASKQSAAAGSSGGMDMSEQSIGGEGAQDGIRGTPSGTQGGQSGQGINQGGDSQQSAQGHATQQHSLHDQASQQGSWPGNQSGIRNDPRTQLDPQEANRDQYGAQQSGATSGEVGDGRSQQQVAQGGSQASQHSKGYGDGSAPGAGTAQRNTGGSQQTGNQQSSSPGGSGTMADKLQGGPGNQQSSGNMGGPGRDGLSQMKEQQQQGGPGNQQSGDNLIGQTTQGSGGSQSADRDSLDALPADAMGGERAGMGSRGHSQQSDKAGNAQADTWSNQSRPNNRSGNEQADRQLGMQGSPGERGHDIDDIGNKQSGGGNAQGGTEDQR